MFDVKYDFRANLITATLNGFLTVRDVERYAAAVEPLIHRAAVRWQGYAILLDVSACAIQAQSVVTAFQQHVGNVPRARRCGVVAGSSIIRMQIRRILTGPSMKMFDDQQTAREWVLSERAVVVE